MRILVTGASGTIGSAVGRALHRRGHEVIGTVTAPEREVPEGVTPHVVDLFQPDALAELANSVDGAVHAASSNDERAFELDRAVATTLVKAFAGTGNPLVYTSGLWLHGSTADSAATEDSPFNPPLVVSWRPEIERIVADAATEGVRTVRIRPGLVYGNGGGYVPMVLAAHDGVVRHFGDGSNRWSVVHADDLADLYVSALESAPAGSVYLATRDESVRVADVASAIAERAGATVQPWDPAEAAPSWGVMVEAFLLDQVATSAKARTELGWQPTRQGLIEDLS